MNKTLFGLALLSYHWEHYKKDIIDSYIPLVCAVINADRDRKVTREKVKENLIITYGINTPLGAIESILKRMIKAGFLIRESGEYLVNFSNAAWDSVKGARSEELITAFDSFVTEIMKYASDNFKVSFSKEEIENGLVNFFKANDLDLLFGKGTLESALPKTKANKKIGYIIAKYITDLQKEDRSKFAIVLKLARGYAIATLITHENLQNFTGSLKDVDIYLDSPIIFNLLGLNGESNLLLARELIAALRSNGANLKIFEVNYGEVINTIGDAIKRLSTGDFEIHKSSRVLRTAIRENISSQGLQLKLNQFDEMLIKLSIERSQSPSLAENEHEFQIDELGLKASIEELYKKDEHSRISWNKANQIDRDVETISNIFKIRKRTRVISLKGCKAILLTTNEVIAFAAKKYEKSEWPFQGSIPVCLTDIFLSTILWANYPGKNENLNIRLLISECYNMIELDNRLLVKFYDDVQRMHKENIISDEQVYLLSASNLAYSLLERITLNDIEEYSDKTPREILEDMQIRIDGEAKMARDKIGEIESRILLLSRFLAKSTFVLIAAILIGVSVYLRAINPPLGIQWVNNTLWIVGALFGCFGFLRWMEVIPTRLKIESWLEGLINKVLRGIVFRE